MIRHKGVITLLSPLIHGGDEKMGTETPFRRIKYRVEERIVEIPVVAGNALRGIMRRVAMDRFLELIEYPKGELQEPMYYAMFSGGSLEKGAATHTIDLPLMQDIRNHLPPISLFGSALANHIMQGKMVVGHAVPIAEETEGYTGGPGKHSIWDLLGDTFYTRRDDREEERTQEQAQQMKYEFEYLAAGTELAHEFIIDQADEIETACFYDTVKLTEKRLLGGRGGIGHGRFTWHYEPEWGDHEPYEDYCRDNAKGIREFIKDLEARLWKAKMPAGE